MCESGQYILSPIDMIGWCSCVCVFRYIFILCVIQINYSGTAAYDRFSRMNLADRLIRIIFRIINSAVWAHTLPIHFVFHSYYFISFAFTRLTNRHNSFTMSVVLMINKDHFNEKNWPQIKIFFYCCPRCWRLLLKKIIVKSKQKTQCKEREKERNENE